MIPTSNGALVASRRELGTPSEFMAHLASREPESTGGDSTQSVDDQGKRQKRAVSMPVGEFRPGMKAQPMPKKP